jgi:hypothetical protein
MIKAFEFDGVTFQLGSLFMLKIPFTACSTSDPTVGITQPW